MLAGMEPPATLVHSNSRRRPKTSELLAGEIVNQIISNGYEDGTRLPSEREMLEIFDVGRSTLREALRLLEARGVITMRAGRNGGPIVRHPASTDLSEALTLLLQFEGSSVADVLAAREALEPAVTHVAAAKITPEQLQVLRETVELIAENGDAATFVRENQRFHSTLAEAADNPVLRTFSDTLKAITDGSRAGVKYTQRYRKSVVDAHLAIIEALERGDGETAAACMHDHLADSARHWRSKRSDLHMMEVRWAYSL